MKHRTRFLADWPSDRLHRLGLRLQRVGWERALSEGEERLWAGLIRELEYRHRRAARFVPRCSCDLCRPPFPMSEGQLDEYAAAVEDVEG